MTRYLIIDAEVTAHRREVESWPWWRQAWHRWIDADCLLCQWYRTKVKHPEE